MINEIDLHHLLDGQLHVDNHGVCVVVPQTVGVGHVQIVGSGKVGFWWSVLVVV